MKIQFQILIDFYINTFSIFKKNINLRNLTVLLQYKLMFKNFF